MISQRHPIDHHDACIFLVDDEPANLKLLEKILRPQGYVRLVRLQDPREVLPAYLEKRPDLILLDLYMPNLSGFEVMAQISELDDPLEPPILVLTAQNHHDILLRALTQGGRDFVTKPFDRSELLARVRNLLDAHLAHRFLHDQNALLEELVRQRTESLAHTRLEVVERLGRAAEYRDNVTGFHILRMSQTSALLARRLGWSDDQVELILNASPMHDVGKIGIPDHILLKPGKLNPEEWAVMQKHAEIGASILAGTRFGLLDMAQEIAIGHHEKWDGSGYPGGLSGEAIPQSARIVALADVFDALTSVRPYKSAWPVADAVDYLQSESGRHFDPAIVPIFIDSLDEILAINARHVDR